MITVYSSDTCGPCKQLKRYLDMADIEYEVANGPENAGILIELTGRSVVPTTVISSEDGHSEVVVGNQPSEILAAIDRRDEREASLSST